MKASVEQQNLLLELAEFDRQLARIAVAFRQLNEDTTLADLQRAEAEAAEELLQASGEHDDVKAELARAENDVELVVARLKRNDERLAQSGSAKDAQALQSESEALRKRQDDLEDMQLAVMEKLDESVQRVDEKKQARDAFIRQIAEAESQREQELAKNASERTAIEAERLQVAETIDGELLALYDRQRERYGIGAARLRGGVSLGSNVALPPTELDEIRKAAADDVVIDPEGGCILIRDESSWP